MAAVSTVEVVKTLAFPIAAAALDQLAGRARDAADAADDIAAALRGAARRAAYGPAATQYLEPEQPGPVEKYRHTVDGMLAAAGGAGHR